mmetsp:Transcript_36672/g.51853  ORF Transcript_36672/g.51853 Transcript_36672/m.51853 type:complete len:116 (+) Transcript_36672:459-806(+)
MSRMLENPYGTKTDDESDLFVVVRNPYDRIVFEYYYVGTHVWRESEETVNDAVNMNKWIGDQLKRASKMRRGIISKDQPGNANYFMAAGTIFHSMTLCMTMTTIRTTSHCKNRAG